MRFSSSYGTITLTDERKEHIFAFHPDVIHCLHHFAEILANPNGVIMSVHDATVVIYYRFLARKKKYLAIVVKLTKHQFILTAYLHKFRYIWQSS
jgi:hypothetical protein